MLLSAVALTACKGNAAISKPDHWVRTDTTSKISDTPGVTFTTESPDKGDTSHPVLQIGCENGKSFVSIYPDTLSTLSPDDTDIEGGRAYKDITWRLGNAPAEKTRVLIGLNSDASMLGWWGSDAETTARKLAGVTQLVIQFDNLEHMGAQSSYEFSFDTSGLDGKLAELTKTCKWPPA